MSCPSKNDAKTSVVSDHKNKPKNTLALLFLLFDVKNNNPNINAVAVDKISTIAMGEISIFIGQFVIGIEREE